MFDRKASCLLIINNERNILAVSRKNDENDFGLPGGKLDEEESFEDAAKRELYEETGLIAEEIEEVFTQTDGNFIVKTFLVKKYSGFISTKESGVVKWASKQELLNGSFGAYNKQLFIKLGF